MDATGTVTDALGASDDDTLTVAEGGATGIRTLHTSFFANRIIWCNSTTENVYGPESTPDPYNHNPGPWTLGIKMTTVADCRSVGMRVMKMPAGNGVVTYCMWDTDGNLITSKQDTWVADGGGWRELTWDAPVEMDAGTVYYFGYHYPSVDQNWALNIYVWNNGQDTCVWPLKVLGTAPPTFYKAGASPTWSGASGDYNWHNAYIDPVVEWDVDVPGYQSGTDYFDQFPNGGPSVPFPLVIDWCDPPWVEEYAALGMNTLIVGGSNENYVEAIKATGMDWYPTLHGGDLSGPQLAADDPDLAPFVRGYMLTDEPEYSNSTPPATLRTWRNSTRRIDSTRPIYLNLGRQIAENQGFLWLPVGISAQAVNEQWREYMSLVDIGSLDCYGIDHTYPYSYQGDNDTDRFGIWIYPLQIYRMRTEVTDGRIPIWGEVETTSAYPNSPSPQQVERCVWSMLIAGAKGILYFDHRFAGPAVGQDFNDMVQNTGGDAVKDAAMSAAVTALNALITSLADALNADEAGYVTGYTSTGTLDGPQGGYPGGADIPMHYSSRVVDIGGGINRTYFFVQSIRDGETTATLEIPGFADAVLTVIGEARTVTVDGSGFFTDDFDDGDYTYHLYYTDTEPAFTAPANTVAPVITTDGTPTTGETITCSTGTWTGVPTPTFTYQWQRDDGGGFDPIGGATSAAYLLAVADEGLDVRCVVTGTNNQGSDSEVSDTVSPSAPAPSAYAAEVAIDNPVAYWRLNDLTEEIGGHDLTNVGGWTLGEDSLITDPTDGSALADLSATARLSTADHVDLRVAQGSFSVECWYTPAGAGNLALISKKGDFRLQSFGTHMRFSPHGAGDWYTDVDTTTDHVAGDTHHVVATWDFPTKIMKIYLDGVLENTVDASTYGFAVTTTGWGNLYIGSGADTISGNNMATGWESGVDEIALYDSVLAGDRVLAHYEAGVA